MSHGGDIYSREVELDFSANINPLGMPEAARAALAGGLREFEAYPDPECRALRRALAEREGAAPENIVCGAGACELLYRLAQVLKPKKALVTAPAFSEYEKALTEAGAEVERFYLTEAGDFRLDGSVTERIPAGGAVLLASPNNPDGGMIDGGVLEKISRVCHERGAVLILDRCFEDFAGERQSGPEPAVTVRAFTKIYAMAGLRLGYLVCADPQLAAGVAGRGPCWNVSVPAQLAGLAALGDREYIHKTRRLISAEREFLTTELGAMGLKVFPSKANFLLFKGPVGLEAELLRRKIAIRCCGDYHGLGPDFYRAAVRTRSENERLIVALSEILGEGAICSDR